MAYQNYQPSLRRYDELIRKLKRWIGVAAAVMVLAGAAIAAVLPRVGAPLHRHVSFALLLLLGVSFWSFVLELVLVVYYSLARRALARAASASNESEVPGLPPT